MLTHEYYRPQCNHKPDSCIRIVKGDPFQEDNMVEYSSLPRLKVSACCTLKLSNIDNSELLDLLPSIHRYAVIVVVGLVQIAIDSVE